jgi:DNA anti-recombination protein RmuC
MSPDLYMLFQQTVQDYGLLGVAVWGLFLTLQYLRRAHEKQTELLNQAYRQNLEQVRAALADTQLKTGELHREHRMELAEAREQFRSDLCRITEQFSHRMDDLGKALQGVHTEIKEIRIEMRRPHHT